MWHREDARQAPGLGGSAEGRARRPWSGGGRGNSGSAIVRLGLINKRLGELLWCTRKGSGACGGEGVDWREVRTGSANGGTAVARGGCACARGRLGADL
jgi:hypothetical protein